MKEMNQTINGYINDENDIRNNMEDKKKKAAKKRRKIIEKQSDFGICGRTERIFIIICQLIVVGILIAEVIRRTRYIDADNRNEFIFSFVYLFLCTMSGVINQYKISKKNINKSENKGSFLYSSRRKRKEQNDYTETLQILPIKKSDLAYMNINYWYVEIVIFSLGVVALNLGLECSNHFNNVIGLIGFINILFLISMASNYFVTFLEWNKKFFTFLYSAIIVFGVFIQISYMNDEANHNVLIKYINRSKFFRFLTGY